MIKWVQKFLLIQSLIVVVMFLISCTNQKPSYQVRVEYQSTPIVDAIVVIEIGGIASPDTTTDGEGIARIFIDSSDVGTPGLLIVKADGYKRHTENIDLIVDELPKVIKLKPTTTPAAEPTTTPTVEPTATPTASPIDTPTVELTITPTEDSTNTQTEETDTFSFLIQVQGNGNVIADAKVSVQVGGKTPLRGITDSEGLVNFILPNSYAAQEAHLIVEANGYETYDRFTPIVKNNFSNLLELEPSSETPAKTYTPVPTKTPSKTHTPTEEPTPDPTAEPATPPTETPIPTPTPLLEGEFALLMPIEPDSLQEPTFGLTQFEWKWSSPLAEGQGFEIRLWRDGASPQGIHNAVEDNLDGTVEHLGDNTYRLVANIIGTPAVGNNSGDYNWKVLLVQIKPDDYKELGYESAIGRLRLVIPGAGGSGDGDGGDGGDDRGDPGPIP